MQLNEFLEKFLPEYEEVKKRYLTEESFEMYYTEFPEALQNFADIICKKQRENCSVAFASFEEPPYREIEACYRNIHIAEQPNIEEL